MSSSAETRTPAWSLPAWVERSPVRAKIARWALGTRFVDPPIRGFALLLGLSGLLPSAAESSEPLYLLFHYASGLLVIASAFIPLASGTVAAALFVVFLFVFPEYLNPFYTALEFASGLLLVRFAWRWSLVMLGVLVGAGWLARTLTPETAMPLGMQLYSWAYIALLGAAAYLVEARIRREIAQREQNARDHERELQRMRLGVATDVHDTVSHGLATQLAIVRLLSVEQDRDESARMLGELAVRTESAQDELRALLTGLHGGNGAGAPAVPVGAAELRSAVARLSEAAAAGGSRIVTTYGELPEALRADTLDDAVFVLRELVTNIIKHASGEGERALRVRTITDARGTWLLLASENPVASPVTQVPWSLSARVTQRGGVCEAETVQDRYGVRVLLPLGGAQISTHGLASESSPDRGMLDSGKVDEMRV